MLCSKVLGRFTIRFLSFGLLIFMSSLAGQLLVASRNLRDPNFRRTVILLLDHNDEGTYGVVLNRPLDRTIREVWETVEFEPCDSEQSLNQGGPVQGPLIALHTSEELGERRLTDGLYLSMQRDTVDPLVRQTEHPFRIYAGNSGWGGGQLEGEMLAGGWYTTPAHVQDIFDPPETLWTKVTNRLALGILMPGQDVNQLPNDPTVN